MMKPSQVILVTGLIAVAFVAACKEQVPPDAKPKTAEKKAAVRREGKPLSLNGAGATFPYPVYAKWTHTYKEVAGVEINYQSIGSGGGIAQVKAKTVDFGATDAPLKKEDLELEGLVQFPLVIGGVVPIINLEGVSPGQLKLTASVLVDIFLGRITHWNDKAIAKLNPGVALPNKEVVVVHRADGSGTTWIFTNYLDKVSPEWHEIVGVGKAVKWPTGMGGKGNEGVASYVQRVSGAIGYVEFAYALQSHMTHVKLQNRDGAYVEPTIASFESAAANADWANAVGFYLVLTDQPGEQSWPITGTSFILLQKEQEDKEKAMEMLKFFDFCYQRGDIDAKALHYVAMPDAVVRMVKDLWKREITVDGAPVWS